MLLLITCVASLHWINPPYTAFTLQSETKVDYDLRDYWVSLSVLPEHLTWSVITAEDQLYFQHSGFDIASIREAWEQRKTGERIRGASTISQQVAKNLFLWPEQTFIRKAVEAGITILLEVFLSKQRILEIYLNTAEFAPGIFGIGKASEHYFGLHPVLLEPEMSARFAVVLPNPARMRVEPPTPFVKERSTWIINQMFYLIGLDYRPIPEPEEYLLPPGFIYEDEDFPWLRVLDTGNGEIRK